MPYVEVAVDSGLPHRGSFSYAVPDGMTLQAGDGVLVPFGRRQLQGIVVQVVEVPAFSGPKPVDARLSDQPVVSPERSDLARWVSNHYLAPLFASVALMLPPGFERRPLTYYEPLVTAAELPAMRLPERQRAVLTYLVERGRIESRQLELELKLPGAATLAQLAQRGLIQRSYALDRPRVQARHMRYVRLRVDRQAALDAAASMAKSRQTRRARALQLLMDEGPSLPAADLRLRAGLGLPQLAPLVAAGLIEVYEEAIERDPLSGRHYQARPGPSLTGDQLVVLSPLLASLSRRKGEAFLLHGVTGSGKTEIYLRALEEAVRLGRRGIVLVPEIALTPQTVRRFAERFPGQVAVLHSGLSQGELYDQWYGIREGRYAVVVGSRSAVFAPQPDLGLIVIDEEHEWTYKQQDPMPRYDAREAAAELARLTGATLLMGSATPDVVSYQRALWGRYQLLELKQRIRPVLDSAGLILSATTSGQLPPVEVVDMKEELKSGNRSVFSRALQLGLHQTLERHEQAILFLNRRGTASHVQCRDCGFVPLCSACALALSYHKHLGRDGGEVERLLCHQCNRTHGLFKSCPMCGSDRLRPMGLGVERVEEALHELFPAVRSLRWDRDVTQGRHSHEQILASFTAGEADVLIGTQMVAKGLDLPAVTLVGAIAADIGLHIPDFRSAERTFQLLTQVAGRAGRVAGPEGGPQPGRVVIQTYTPDNYAIQAAAGHDFASFFAQEIALRQEEAYPPFVRLARLIYSHAKPDVAERQAVRMAQELRLDIAKRGLPGADVVGPAPPHVPRWHGRYRWQITVRSPDPAELFKDLTLAEGWTLDIDPVSLA